MDKYFDKSIVVKLIELFRFLIVVFLKSGWTGSGWTSSWLMLEPGRTGSRVLKIEIVIGTNFNTDQAELFTVQLGRIISKKIIGSGWMDWMG